MAVSIQTRTLGLWGAGASALCSAAYTIAQLGEWLGWLGSAGGPGAQSTPLGIMVLLLPSLILGPAWVATLAAIAAAVPRGAKGVALAALALGSMYAALTGLVYFVQITFVAPRLAGGAVTGIELLLFVPYRSFLFAIDLYGYSLMCASAALAGWAVHGHAALGRARLWLWLTGLLTPALALQMTFPWLIWAGSLWGVSFPLASLLLWRSFAELKPG
ncbi:hypothetical protein [Novosphingobium sp.]|uniref:hypothetical protein n=1 Tax=Novosphingobium sp. TaxID=1874826 RepID=UPI0025CD39C6|nr:hypothetical protein [Novosphingobium sp.]